jgi:hypothetical protein
MQIRFNLNKHCKNIKKTDHKKVDEFFPADKKIHLFCRSSKSCHLNYPKKQYRSVIADFCGRKDFINRAVCMLLNIILIV